MIKEAAVGNLREALQAQERGADRIELCENLAEEGTTPSYGTIKEGVETTITFTPAEGWYVAEVRIDGRKVELTEESTYKIGRAHV